MFTRRGVLQLLVDAAVVAFSLFLAFWVRLEFSVNINYVVLLRAILPLVVVSKLIVFFGAGLYKRWWRYTSVGDGWVIFWSNVFASASAAGVVYIAVVQYHLPRHLPRSVILIDFVICLSLIVFVRFLARFLHHRQSNDGSRRARPVIVIGAGDAGDMIIKEMRRNPQLGHTPVALLDDDPRKRGTVIGGVKVVGNTSEMLDVARELDAEEVIIAMPTAPGQIIKDIVYRCEKAGLECKTLPGVFELIKGTVSVNELRDIQIEDILGRDEIEVDLKSIAGYLQGKRVMVTGAGGSIGSELCRQIIRLRPAGLMLVDHAEDNLFNIEQELEALEAGSLVALVADVKEEERMDAIFRQYEPQVVFHAAAYKHVPLMQQNPCEAVANNSAATALMAALSGRHGVERFLLISTDKAVKAQTVMGMSKALAERAVQAIADTGRYDTRFMIVRFGNVLGSSGSVVPIFTRQIERGGPVTVTHEEMTRFFMTIPEAVRLVIQAGAMGSGGEIFVLDMGRPVKIIDLARNMIELTGHDPDEDIKIVITGVRPGEKLHEELFNEDEELAGTSHPKIRLARRKPVDEERMMSGLQRLLAMAADGSTDGEVTEAMAAFLASCRGEVTPA